MELPRSGEEYIAAVTRRRRRAIPIPTPPSNALLTELSNFPPLDEILTESGLPIYTDP